MGLTDKEAVVFLTRLAALDNALTTAGTQRELWQNTFLELLYTMCTQVIPPHVSPRPSSPQHSFNLRAPLPALSPACDPYAAYLAPLSARQLV